MAKAPVEKMGKSWRWACCVPFCDNKVEVLALSNISFHRIPKNEEMRKEWLTAIRRTEGEQGFKIIESTRVCSAHFKLEDWRLHLHSTMRLLKETAVPSKFLWNSGQLIKPRPLQVSATIKEIRLKTVEYRKSALRHKQVQSAEPVTFQDGSTQANLVRHPLCDPALIGEYSQCRDHPLPSIFRAAIVSIHKFSDLTFSFHLWEGGLPTYMEITRVGWYGTPCAGQVPVKVTLSSSGEMCFLVLCMHPITRNVMVENGHMNQKCFGEFLYKMSKDSRNIWCRGVNSEEQSKMAPWTRRQAKDCEVFFTATQNASSILIALGIGRCAACNRQRRIVALREQKLVPAVREKRVRMSSRCPIRSLSPESKRKRLENYRKVEKELKEKVEALRMQLRKCDDRDGTCTVRNANGAGVLDLDCTKEVHSGENSLDSDNWTDNSDTDFTEDLQKCKICERTFTKKQHLQRHLRSHQLEHFNACNNESTLDIGYVKQRLRTHSDCLGHQVKTDFLLGIISVFM